MDATIKILIVKCEKSNSEMTHGEEYLITEHYISNNT